MTEHNHRNGTKRKNGPGIRLVAETIVMQEGVSYAFSRRFKVTRHDDGTLTYVDCVGKEHMKGYAPSRPWRYNVNINKTFGRTSKLANVRVSAGSGYDHSNGHRGEARAVRGAKKYVNSRHRFHEKAATRELAKQDDDRD